MSKFSRFLPIVILLALTIWAGKGLFRYEVYYTQDFKRHLSRSYDAVITLNDGGFPLRWAGILNYECGVPMFNFYNPLLYYLAASLYVFTGSLLLSLKIINLLALFVGSLFFYLWANEETKDKLVSLSASSLYLFAPYTFLLIYVRGSPEYLSYSILPIVLFFYSKTFKATSVQKSVKFAFLAAISGGFLMISHNLAALLSLSVITVYFLVKMFSGRSVQNIKIITFSLMSIIGLAVFFIFPAILEKNFTKLGTPIFNYQDHFPTVAQVIKSKWGYGDSAIGTADDGMSFQLGYAQWLVLALGIILVVWKSRKNSLLVLAFLGLSLLFLYLVLPVSLPVWDKVGILQTFQFSWRFLGITVFTIAAFYAFFVSQIKSKSIKTLVLITVASIAVIGNRNHLLPQPVYENDLPFYLGLDKIGSQRRFLSDFSDTVLSPNAEVSCYLTTPVAETTNNQDLITVNELSRGSTHGKVKISLNKDNIRGEKIILNLGYYPEIFDLRSNGSRVNYSDCEGRVCIEVSSFNEGDNEISWKVGQTTIQKIFNLVTLTFFGVWVFMLLRVRSKK